MTQLKIVVTIFLLSFLTVFSQKDVSWKDAKTRGSSPLECENPACVISKDSLYVYGGRMSVTGWSNNIHSFNFADSTWKRLSPSGDVPTLDGHVMERIGSKFFIHGGRNSLWTPNTQTFVFDTDTEVFKNVNTTGSTPPGLFASCSISKGTNFILFGGSNRERENENDQAMFIEKNDVYSLNTETSEWTKLETTGNAPFLQAHRCVTFGNKMYVFGGISKKEFSSTVYSFDLEKNHWSVVTSMKPRTFFSVSVVDQHAYIYGGTNSQFHLDELSIFNLVTHSWEVTRIVGKSTAKQGHCSVSHDGKVYTFGGRSEKFQFLKDLVILDTKPGTTKKEEKDLSSKIQDDITKYTTLYEAKFVPTTLQNELKEIIESDSKEEEFLKSIQNQLASWDEISTTYSMMVASRSNVQNISSSFDFDLKKIENMVASMAARKLVLSELVAKLQASMSDLKDKEQGLKTQISKKTTTKDAYDQILAKIRSNELDLNTLKGDRANYVHDEARLKERLVLLEKRKKDLQKTAEYSNAQEKEKKELQKELGEELTKIREALSKLEEEIEKYGKDIEEKSEKLDEVVKSFQKSKETKDIIDSLSKLSEQLNEKTEEFNLKMKMISSVLSIDFDQSTTTPRNQNDFIQKLNSANNKDELIKKKAQLSAEIDNLKKIIAEKNEISYSLKRKEAITKKNYDDVSSTLGHMLGENSQKTKDIEAVEKEWTDVNSQIHILKENVAETFVTEKSLIEKLKESKDQEIEKKEKFLEAQKTEFESHKNLESTQRQLESQYASLHEQLMEHIKENLDLEKLGHELEASKAVFANQRKSVENYKQMLLAKMKEVDDQRNAEMNKVVAELKKKSDELESQLKEKVSQSTEKETQLTAALSEKEVQIKQLEEKIAQLELEAKNKTVPEPTPVATETTPETPEPTPATEQIPVENQEQTKSE